MPIQQSISVSKGACPLDTLAELGDSAKNARIFFDSRCFADLVMRADSVKFSKEKFLLFWDANPSENYPETSIQIRSIPVKGYFELLYHSGEDSSFCKKPKLQDVLIEYYFNKIA